MRPMIIDIAIAENRHLNVSAQKRQCNAPRSDRPTMPKYMTKTNDPTPSPSTISTCDNHAPKAPPVLWICCPELAISLTDIDDDTMLSSKAPLLRWDTVDMAMTKAMTTSVTPMARCVRRSLKNATMPVDLFCFNVFLW